MITALLPVPFVYNPYTEKDTLKKQRSSCFVRLLVVNWLQKEKFLLEGGECICEGDERRKRGA